MLRKICIFNKFVVSLHSDLKKLYFLIILQ